MALKEREESARLTAAMAMLVEPGAEVHVVHVLGTSPAQAVADANALVEDAVQLLRANGLTAQGHVESVVAGGVAQKLVEVAIASNVEAIVVGSRGLGEVAGLISASVSHALLTSLDLPVLVVPANAHLPEGAFRRVLAAVADRDEGDAAAAAVRMLPGPVEVMAVHVPRLLALHVGPGWGGAFLELGETSPVVLTDTRRRMTQAGLPARIRSLSRRSSVSRAIIEAAREWHADLIVVGSRRLKDWKALLAGSTSHGVLHLSDRAVLISGRRRHPRLGQPVAAPAEPVVGNQRGT